MEFYSLGEMQIILLIAIVSGVTVGLATFLVAHSRQNASSPVNTSLQAPTPAPTDRTRHRRLRPDDRAPAVALVDELTRASRQDGMS